MVYDIAIVGAGPAGIMAALRAAEYKRNIALIERNDSIGRKLLLSGKERCNLTNAIPIDEFIVRFGRQGEFLRSAFSRFSNRDLMDFFEAKGLKLKIERQGRIFPESGQAQEVLEVLKQSLFESKVKILFHSRLTDIQKEGDGFLLFLGAKESIGRTAKIAEKVICHLPAGRQEGDFLEGARQIRAKRAILACGGRSFSWTGSSGDGFEIARGLGHNIVSLKPALAALRVKEPWVKELDRLILKNIRISFKGRNKKIVSEVGELHFTPFGVSGALVLDLSREALDLLEKDKRLILEIDLKPGLTYAQLEARLLREFKANGRQKIEDILKGLLPLKLIGIFVNLIGLERNKAANQVSSQERLRLINLLKGLPLRIIGSLPLEEAMVTWGGVSTKEINPRTMESRLVSGLYFAGEMIDASADKSGGYNLQQAFSTGYLAGESAAK